MSELRGLCSPCRGTGSVPEWGRDGLTNEIVKLLGPCSWCQGTGEGASLEDYDISRRRDEDDEMMRGFSFHEFG